MMFKQCKQKPPLIFIIALLISATLSIGTAQAYYQELPFTTGIQLINMTYSYNPSTQILTKSYTLKNVSGMTLPSPRLVNLFLWSNNICSTSYVTMGYNGASAYSNLDQGASVNNDGLIDWNHDVNPANLSSTVVFPALPVQSAQTNVTYPYVTISVAAPGTGWVNNEQVTVNVTFTGVLNCNWIQNMVSVIYDAGGGGSPTVIALSQFEALPGDGAVTLMWATESEKDTTGFNIYRGKVGFGRSGRGTLDSVEMEKINTTIISATGSATSGAEYTYTDDDVKNGFTYIYKLEDVDINGVATEHGPVTATPRWIHSLYHLFHH